MINDIFNYYDNDDVEYIPRRQYVSVELIHIRKCDIQQIILNKQYKDENDKKMLEERLDELNNILNYKGYPSMDAPEY